VIARSERNVLGFTTTTSFEVVDASIDLVVVAVSPSSVPAVIDQLARRTRATVMLDTPVLQPTHLRTLCALSHFRRVLVAEDTLALPPFVVARQLIDDGAIGALRRIWFFHCGYKYHALASLKMLAGTRSIHRLISRKYQGKLRIKELQLGGVTAVMYEPRDYSIGRFLIEGERGCIADYDLQRDHVHRIGYVQVGDIYRGLTLDGVPRPPDELERRYLEHIGTDVHDASLMNTMKIRGLIELLNAALLDHSPLHYSAVEGVSDSLHIQIADRIGYVPARAVEKVVARFGL